MDPESTDLFVETSVLVSIVFRESGYVRLLDVIGARAEVFLSAANLAEALLVVERRNGAAAVAELEILLEKIEATVVPFDAAQARLAHEAFQRYGKGRHPAGLNFGGCLSYAAAKACGARLLYVGKDFERTDLA